MTFQDSRPIWERLIPSLRDVTSGTGVWRGSLPFSVVFSGGTEGAAKAAAVTPLLDRVNTAALRITGLDRLFRLSTGGTGTAESTVRCEYVPGEGEGYDLRVGTGEIVIGYTDGSSLAAALATLTQAILLDGDLTPDASSVTLPAATVHDEPATEWRGFMIDTARHFFPPSSLDRMVDIVWLLRLNRFHLHLTDDQGWRFPVASYPRLASVAAVRDDRTSEGGTYGGYYELNRLRRLDHDATLLGITVVPEIDLPGHASAAITAYPDLTCSRTSRGVETRWGIFDGVLCASRRESYDFIDAVFTTVGETFSGPYIHIGGDEVPDTTWNGCPDCRSLNDPFQTIVRSMADAVVRLGRRPVAWDEASNLDLPSSTIIVNWREPEDAVAALRRGYDLVLAPQRQACYLDHKHIDTPLEPGRLGTCTVMDSASFAPAHYVQDHIEGTGQGGRILGGQANLWTEAVPYHRNVEYMAYTRLAAIAEGLWHGRPAASRPHFYSSLEELRRRLLARGFSLYPGPFTDPRKGKEEG